MNFTTSPSLKPLAVQKSAHPFVNEQHVCFPNVVVVVFVLDLVAGFGVVSTPSALDFVGPCFLGRFEAESARVLGICVQCATSKSSATTVEWPWGNGGIDTCNVNQQHIAKTTNTSVYVAFQLGCTLRYALTWALSITTKRLTFLALGMRGCLSFGAGSTFSFPISWPIPHASKPPCKTCVPRQHTSQTHQVANTM